MRALAQALFFQRVVLWLPGMDSNLELDET
jgi:hypothetical protein